MAFTIRIGAVTITADTREDFHHVIRTLEYTDCLERIAAKWSKTRAAENRDADRTYAEWVNEP